jgi:hypothetical protein
MSGSRLVERHLNQSNQEQRRYSLRDLINPVRLSAEVTIGSVLCSRSIVPKEYARTVIEAQESLYNAVVSSFLKHLFPPTTQNNGASPHTPITLSALFQGLTIYR